MRSGKSNERFVTEATEDSFWIWFLGLHEINDRAANMVMKLLKEIIWILELIKSP